MIDLGGCLCGVSVIHTYAYISSLVLDFEPDKFFRKYHKHEVQNNCINASLEWYSSARARIKDHAYLSYQSQYSSNVLIILFII